MNDKLFFNPRFEGHRFNDHTIPVNILEDFAAFEELIFELAKTIYLEKNPSRKRVPKGFTDKVYLKISSIEGGSAIPKILIALVTSATTPAIPVDNSDYFQYFENAREKVFELIENANLNQPTNIDTKFLNYFNRIGKNLEDGESIDLLNEPSSERNVKLDKNTRRKILLSRSEKIEYSEPINDNIFIHSIDKKNQTFKIEISDTTIEASIIKDFENIITQAFDEYEKKTRVSIKATGVFNSQNKLIHIEKIESMDILDPFDVRLRLADLSKLENNWYNGDGLAPNVEALNNFEQYFQNYYNTNLSLPAIFPTLEGNILLEWKYETNEITLEVTLSSLESVLFYFDMRNDKNDFEKTLNLKNEDHWNELNDLIKKHINPHE